MIGPPCGEKIAPARFKPPQLLGQKVPVAPVHFCNPNYPQVDALNLKQNP
jgi:hypothetical protein